MTDPVHIVGGGLAGCEAAWQLVSNGVPVVLYEMRPTASTPAHKTDGLAELVCSNSFRSDDPERSAIGLLHEEMRNLNSLVMKCADQTCVPAGGALAVDRDQFSKSVGQTLFNHPLFQIKREEVSSLIRENWNQSIIATGPLTSQSLATEIVTLSGKESLAFFDAIAPIIHKDSIDFSIAWFQSRYDKGTGSDYINCPMTEDQYYAFINELLLAKKTEFKDWERDTPYFEGCLPIEVMASRGPKTLAFGPMKPVGLTNPNNPHIKPFAIVQLRQDNLLGTLFNMVGFQTKLKYQEQTRIFRMIPGLENAEFARLGGIHRNTFINSPKLLDRRLRFKKEPRARFAGQMTGCEGYIESASVGLLAGLFCLSDVQKVDIPIPPIETSLGSLLAHITGNASEDDYQPMNVNFGLFPPLDQHFKKRDRKKAYSDRARKYFFDWKSKLPTATPLKA